MESPLKRPPSSREKATKAFMTAFLAYIRLVFDIQVFEAQNLHSPSEGRSMQGKLNISNLYLY